MEGTGEREATREGRTAAMRGRRGMDRNKKENGKKKGATFRGNMKL